jgi:translation initiation factor 1
MGLKDQLIAAGFTQVETPAVEQPTCLELKGDKVRVGRAKQGRGGKVVTTVEGLQGSQAALEALCLALKQAVGAGGQLVGSVIEIQGEQRQRLLSLLAARGIQAKQAGS